MTEVNLPEYWIGGVPHKPAYAIRKLRAPRKRTCIRFTEVTDSNGKVRDRKMETYEKDDEPGYMVYLPSGQSLRVTGKELSRLGFDKPAEIVDMTTGERHSLEEASARGLEVVKKGFAAVKSVVDSRTKKRRPEDAEHQEV